MRFSGVLTERNFTIVGAGLARPSIVWKCRRADIFSLGWKLTSTCRRHDVDPQLYFTQLLMNLPPLLATLPYTRRHELEAWLPDNWKLLHAARTATLLSHLSSAQQSASLNVIRRPDSPCASRIAHLFGAKYISKLEKFSRLPSLAAAVKRPNLVHGSISGLPTDIADGG
ncbi:MAG TPA: hypothetical protein VL128_18480 [Candidatus Eisenbacteria bacterium]|nr:hypothetical protein [Candidatus Eisenbacteria bacterium]